MGVRWREWDFGGGDPGTMEPGGVGMGTWAGISQEEMSRDGKNWGLPERCPRVGGASAGREAREPLLLGLLS